MSSVADQPEAEQRPHVAAVHKRRAMAAAVKAGTQQCLHEMVHEFDGKVGCSGCWKLITEPTRLVSETAKMEAALAEDGTGDAHSEFLWSRAVTASWLVDFTNKYDCWKWKTWQVQAFIIKPETEKTRLRYVDLPHVRAAAGVGPADVMVSRESPHKSFSLALGTAESLNHRCCCRARADCWGGTWGSLVAAADRGAKPGRRVWIDLFAVRQWPGNAADLDFVGVIVRVKAVLLVAQALPAVAELNFADCYLGKATVPESVRRMVAFMRVWCLGESLPRFSGAGCQPLHCWEDIGVISDRCVCDAAIVELMAARDNNIPVVMCCGAVERDASTSSGFTFVDDPEALSNLEWLVDVTTAEATNPRDKARILEQVAAAEGGATGLSSDVSGWISGAVAAADEASDSPRAAAAVQAAMCGELEQLAAIPVEQLGAAVRVAAALGAEAALINLLGRSAPVEEPESVGWTALMFAARAGWAGVVPLLVSAGAGVNKVNPEGDRMSALYYAASSGRAKAVAALLQAGAAVDQAAVSGCTPLFTAAQQGHVTVVVALLTAGAAVDQAKADGGTPLFIAALRGRTAVVAALLKSGAAVDHATDTGCTPLFMAADGGHEAVVGRLIAAGATVDKARTTTGSTPLLVAAQNGHEVVVGQLITAGATVDTARTTDGSTPLFVAASNGHAAVVVALLAAGARKDARALETASKEGHAEVVALLEDPQ